MHNRLLHAKKISAWNTINFLLTVHFRWWFENIKRFHNCTTANKYPLNFCIINLVQSLLQIYQLPRTKPNLLAEKALWPLWKTHFQLTHADITFPSNKRKSARSVVKSQTKTFIIKLFQPRAHQEHKIVHWCIYLLWSKIYLSLLSPPRRKLIKTGVEN